MNYRDESNASVPSFSIIRPNLILVMKICVIARLFGQLRKDIWSATKEKMRFREDKLLRSSFVRISSDRRRRIPESIEAYSIHCEFLPEIEFH